MADDGEVVNVPDALDAIVSAIRETGAGRQEAPQMILVIAQFADGERETYVAGPGYNEEAHLKLLGHAGRDAAKAMGIDPDKPKEPKLILASRLPRREH